MTDQNNPPAANFPFLVTSSGATLTASDTSAGLALRKSANSSSGDNSAFIGKAVPSGNWVAVARIKHAIRGRGDRARHGLAIEDSSTGKIIFVGVDGGAQPYTSLACYYYTNTGSFNSGLFSERLAEPETGDNWPEWYRITWNGTQYTFEFSRDGAITWILAATALASSYFTADKVGFFLNHFQTPALPETMIVTFYDDGDPFPGTSPHYLVGSVASEVLSTGDGSTAQAPTVAAAVLSSGAPSKAIVATTAIQVLSTVALAPTRALDGGKVYDIQFAFQPETIYNESDWDSIWSVGDRYGNGLLIPSTGGFPTHFGDVNAMFNANYGFAAGDGFQPGGSGTGWPIGAYWGWRTADTQGLGTPPSLFISGIRFVSSASTVGDGFWQLWGGYSNVPWMISTLEFNEFTISITTHNPDGSWIEPLTFTPPFLPFDSWFVILGHANDGEDNFGGANMGSEMELKVYHSVLDGGDRRATNGRSIKRVTMSTSSGITATAGVGVDALSIAFDGKYAYNNRGSGSKTSPMSFHKTGASTPFLLDVPGQYIQFNFPRKVFMREMVWNTDSAEVMSGSDPTVYGTWQWQGSNAQNSGFVDVGGPWHFAPGSDWVRSPKPINEGDPATPYQNYMYPYWRMVLVEGPAFGPVDIYQIMFNLIDPDNQSAIMELAFTDGDSDVMSGSVSVINADPTKLGFTDGDSDALTATLSIVNNLFLAGAFTDGDSDALQGRSSLAASTVVQTIAIVKGR